MPRGLLSSPWWRSGRAIRQTHQPKGACSPSRCIFCFCYTSDIMCKTALNGAAMANSIVSIKGPSEVCIQTRKREKTFKRVLKGELKFRWQANNSKSQSEVSLRAGPAVAAGTGLQTHHLRGQRQNESSQKSQQLVTNKSSLQLSQCFTTQQRSNLPQIRGATGGEQQLKEMGISRQKEAYHLPPSASTHNSGYTSKKNPPAHNIRFCLHN